MVATNMINETGIRINPKIDLIDSFISLENTA